MIRVIGDGVIPEVRAFDRVREALEFDEDVYLAAMWCKLTGETIPDGAAIYNMEPLYDGCRSFSLGYLDTLKRCRVIDYDRRNVEYLATFGVDAFHMPYGFHESLFRWKRQNTAIDILLVGSVNGRRQRIVNELRKRFDIVWATGAYGKALDSLVGMAKVCLNIHYVENHPLEVARLNYLIANGCTVVSEPGWDDEVNNDYSNGVYITENIGDACEYALENPMNGTELARTMWMNCKAANNWLKEKTLCLG
jgi:hypothetical protein